jgi:hypothetical protein
MAEPLTMILTTAVLTEAVKFLHNQAGDLLRRWRERRDATGTEVAAEKGSEQAARRGEILQFCVIENLFAPPVPDQATVTAIAEHIFEVCEEWRWM